MMKTIGTWFRTLPSTTQLIVIAAAGLAIYLIFKRIAGFFDGLKNGSANKGYIDGLKNEGYKQTFSNKQYRDMASSLYKAMKGMNINVSKRNAIIYNIFKKMKNELDVLMLDDAFGIRDNADLQTWLQGEYWLDLNVINNHFANQGIEKSY